MSTTRKTNPVKINIIKTKEDLAKVGVEKLNITNNKKKTGKQELTFYIPESPVYAKETAEDFIERVKSELEATSYPSITTRVSFNTIRDLVFKGVMPLNKIKDGKINRNDVMDFQRNEATSDNWKSSVILSATTAYVLPAITAMLQYDNSNNSYSVVLIDGQQRAISIDKFLNGDFKISGTKSKLDGMYYSELRTLYPELQKAINNCVVEISIIDPIFASNSDYRTGCFTKINTTSTTLTGMEINNAEFCKSDFLKKINQEIDNPEKDTFIRDIIFNKDINPAKKTEIKIDRMREKMRLFYAYALSRQTIEIGDDSFEMNHEFKDDNQQKCLESLFAASCSSNNKCNEFIKELRATAKFLHSNFGEYYAHKLFIDTEVDEDGRQQNWCHLMDRASSLTNYRHISRCSAVSNHNLYSLFYLSYVLRKTIYKKGSTVSKKELEVLRSITERVFAGSDYCKLTVSCTTSKIQRRSASLVRTVLEYMLKYDAFSGANAEEKEDMAKALIEAYKNEKMPSFNLYTCNKNYDE